VYESIEEFEQAVPSSGLVLLSGDDGHSSLGRVRDRLLAGGRYMPVAMYSSKPDVGMIVEAMLSGALDYLTWPFCPAEIEASIVNMAKRSSGVAEAERRRIEARALVERLSRREREILARMMTGKSNKTMGQELGISPRTVEIHRGNLIRRLAVGTTAEAVRLGLYAGLDDDCRLPS
jgi:FixJ family two-component response regulator